MNHNLENRPKITKMPEIFNKRRSLGIEEQLPALNSTSVSDSRANSKIIEKSID